jgi:Protein of unknown function (DUF726)
MCKSDFEDVHLDGFKLSYLMIGLTLELMKRGAMLTVLSSLVTAIAWPAALLSATNWIDSKWSIAIDRYSFTFENGLLCASSLLNLGNNMS